MVKRIFPLLALLFTLALYADNSMTVKLTSLAGIAKDDKNLPGAAASSEAEVAFRSERNRNVKSQLTLTADIADTAWMDISRAFIKARFPAFRLTLGKTRLSWGEGFMFNAGDVIFDSLSTATDLTGDEIRTNTAWLASAYMPLGRFRFLEAVVLPPVLDLQQYLIDRRLSDQGLAGDPEIPESDQSAAGARIVLRPAGIKTEAGYLYSGSSEEHRPYISLQGHLLVDWHISAATRLSIHEGGRDGAKNTAVSCGLFQVIRTEKGRTVTLRLEGAVRPTADWHPDDDEYALFLYPEIRFAPDDRRTLFYRSIISPVDISSAHVVGTSWEIYQGFKLLLYGGIAAGDREDRFSWEASGEESVLPGYFLSAGCSFVF